MTTETQVKKSSQEDMQLYNLTGNKEYRMRSLIFSTCVHVAMMMQDDSCKKTVQSMSCQSYDIKITT